MAATQKEAQTREVLNYANTHLFYCSGGDILPFAWGLSLEAAEAVVLLDGDGAAEALEWLSRIVKLCRDGDDVKRGLLTAMFEKRTLDIWEQRPRVVCAKLIDSLAALAG